MLFHRTPRFRCNGRCTLRDSLKRTPFALVYLLLAAVVLFAQPAKNANKFLGNIMSYTGVPRENFTTYWNHITAENACQWWGIEQSRDKMNWQSADIFAEFAREASIPWRFHALLTSGSYPGWMAGLSDTLLLAEISTWMDSVAARYPDVTMIDVVNEGHPTHGFPVIFKKALGGDGVTGFDWIITAFKMARQRWPKALLIYNDYNNLEYEQELTWTLDLIAAMKSAGAPIDVIGCEGLRLWEMNTDTLSGNIDRIAAAGLPVYISCMGIEEGYDSTQARCMRELFPVLWNHPKVIGITYWGYVQNQTWRSNMHLLSKDGIERPALTWLKEYVENNPDPPNDFPGLLNPKTGITTSPRGVLSAGSTTAPGANYRRTPRIFTLQGRSVRSPANGSTAVGRQAAGWYINSSAVHHEPPLQLRP